MLKRLYIHNFKSLQNFELDLSDLHSALLLGKNGSGKTTIFEAIEIFQKIGRGVTPLDDLFEVSSFHFSNTHLPIELALEVELNKKHYQYKLMIEFPEGFTSPRVKSETLVINKAEVLSRVGGKTLFKGSDFSLDWHHIGLPLISVTANHPLSLFREWLQNILILSPFPRNFNDLSKKESATLTREAQNIIDWLRWLLSSNPSLYSVIYDFLKIRMPDLEVFKFGNLGSNDRALVLTFSDGGNSKEVNFGQLSDGEKIFFLIATVIAGQKNNPTMLCLWDEPENFISLIEVNHFIMEFRKAFEMSSKSSQLMVSSHNSRVINGFSDHNIFVLTKETHLSPTRVRVLESIGYESRTLIDAYDNGELDS
jgi:ABC-type cobalamin/Fe3+-siderophores transport system ATPase subunit